MTKVARWVQELTEKIMGGSPLEIGKRYVHPEDGAIRITGGQYWGEYGLSNFWHWEVEATGQIHHGYGDAWPEFTTASETATPPAAHIAEAIEAAPIAQATETAETPDTVVIRYTKSWVVEVPKRHRTFTEWDAVDVQEAAKVCSATSASYQPLDPTTLGVDDATALQLWKKYRAEQASE